MTDAYKKSDVKGIARLVNLSWAYIISCNLIIWASQAIFSFDPEPMRSAPRIATWKIVVGGASVLALVVLILRYSRRWPKWVGTIFTAALVLNFAWQAFNDFYNKGRFHSSATMFWLLAVGVFFSVELTLRSWKPTLGDWPQTLIALLALVMVFATRYYPHIMSSWGGGMPIPITVTFTKDAVKTPSQDIDYLLVDETDAGFYVVGTDEKTAIFIPRSAAGMVRFSASNPTTSH